MMKKVICIFTITFLLIGMLGCSKAQNWKKIEKDGVSFNVPEDWQKKEEGGVVKIYENSKKPFVIMMEIINKKDVETDNIDKYMKEIVDIKKEMGNTNKGFNIENSKISGMKSVEISYGECMVSEIGFSCGSDIDVEGDDAVKALDVKNIFISNSKDRIYTFTIYMYNDKNIKEVETIINSIKIQNK